MEKYFVEKYFVEAKLGMSDGWSLIKECDTLEEAFRVEQEYTDNQLKGDLYADSNIVKLSDLTD